MPATVSPMLSFAQYYFLVLGLITILGGVMGYVKANSVASLIAGSASGGLLLAAGFLLRGIGASFIAGEVLALVVSLLLLGRFTPALVRGKKMPAIYLVPLCAIGVVVAVVLMVGAAPH